MAARFVTSFGGSMKLWTLALALLLMGCVSQSSGMPERIRAGLYPNYRVMLQGELYRQTQDQDFAKCGADMVLANLTPAELSRLDSYARGEASMSNSDLQKIDADLRGRVGEPTKETLRPYCPDKVDTFRI